MDAALLLIIAGLFAMIALPFAALGQFITTRQLIRTQRSLATSDAIVDALRDELSQCETLGHNRRRPPGWPPGAIPIELALAVHEGWKKAGYHMVGDTRVVLRLISIAHRIMCALEPDALSGAVYDDGDRCAPAKVACVATGQRPCTWPDCYCIPAEETKS